MRVGGPGAPEFEALFAPLGMRMEVVSTAEVGRAVAVKMFRSVIYKGLEALIFECVMGASHYGAEPRVFASLEKDFESYLQHKSEKEVRELHEKTYIAAMCEQALIKGYMQVIADAYENIVAQTFDGLLKTARKFTDGFLRGKLEYRNGELGYWRNPNGPPRTLSPSTWVSWKAFSGIEELATFAGLSVALAPKSPIKIVIMDELGRLSGDNKRALLIRMSELIHAHELDQFIGLDVSIRDYGDAKRMITEIKVEEP